MQPEASAWQLVLAQPQDAPLDFRYQWKVNIVLRFSLRNPSIKYNRVIHFPDRGLEQFSPC